MLTEVKLHANRSPPRYHVLKAAASKEYLNPFQLVLIIDLCPDAGKIDGTLQPLRLATVMR